MFPCLNPAGLAENRREGLEKIDFNRDYLQPATSLIRAHVAWLESQPRFDLAVLLHEDWEADGFYVYALGQDERAGQIVGTVSKVCPILQADRADDWPALSGVVRPSEKRINRPDWPEALYLFRKKTEVCYTLEAPSDYDLSTRVTALTTGVRAAMEFAEREAD
jgi:hypothetical protein